MNEEEKKAIESLNEILFENAKEITLYELGINDLKTALNLIEKQKKEIEKKDRQIDLMAEWIEEYTGDCPCDMYDWQDIDCEKTCENSTKKCWEQYFKNKTEEDK